jgi:hypothetical protein
MRIEVEITPRSVLPAILWLVWAIAVVALLSLALGGYQEHEPRAGTFFMLMAAAIFIVGPAVNFIFKKRSGSQEA